MGLAVGSLPGDHSSILPCELDWWASDDLDQESCLVISWTNTNFFTQDFSIDFWFKRIQAGLTSNLNFICSNEIFLQLIFLLSTRLYPMIFMEQAVHIFDSVLMEPICPKLAPSN